MDNDLKEALESIKLPPMQDYIRALNKTLETCGIRSDCSNLVQMVGTPIAPEHDGASITFDFTQDGGERLYSVRMRLPDGDDRSTDTRELSEDTSVALLMCQASAPTLGEMSFEFTLQGGHKVNVLITDKFKKFPLGSTN